MKTDLKQKYCSYWRTHKIQNVFFYNFCYYFWGQHCCWTCKCETNDYYGCAFTL